MACSSTERTFVYAERKNKSYVLRERVRVLPHVPCLRKHFGPLCFSSECLFQTEQKERDAGRKAGGRERERPRCIPISPAHWGRTVPKILGLRWSPLRPPISNSQSPQPSAIQIITTNGVKLDGYVQHAEPFQYTVRLLHVKVVNSGGGWGARKGGWVWVKLSQRRFLRKNTAVSSVWSWSGAATEIRGLSPLIDML